MAETTREESTSVHRADCDQRSWRRRLGWSANGLAAPEDLHHDHRVATVRADEGRPPVVERILVLLGIVRRHLQQLACEGKVGAAAAVGQYAVVADSVKAARQH